MAFVVQTTSWIVLDTRPIGEANTFAKWIHLHELHMGQPTPLLVGEMENLQFTIMKNGEKNNHNKMHRLHETNLS